MRSEKGITLVALILIIVVLVILAGISISLVVNNETNNVEIDPNNNQINQEPEVSSVVDNTTENVVETNTVEPENTVVE